MKVTFEEYQAMYKEINGSIWTPEAKVTQEEVDGVMVDMYEIIRTAQENYDYINAPKIPQPTELEITQARLEETKLQLNAVSSNLNDLMDFVDTLQNI